MEYSIVTNYKINTIFKNNSRYYRVSLGYASTMEGQGGDRSLNKKDDFAFFYNTRYKTTIQGQGTIGNINFYTDHYIMADQLAFYYDKEEYVFDFDYELVKKRGVDFYIGHLIKKIETELKMDLTQERVKAELPEEKPKAESVSIMPGAVKYEDLKAYLEKKNAERLKI